MRGFAPGMDWSFCCGRNALPCFRCLNKTGRGGNTSSSLKSFGIAVIVWIAICSCIDSEAANITSRSLVYWPTPSNYLVPDGRDCKFKTSCNSNYSTHCMMKRCGITAVRPYAPGWDHRMSRCKNKAPMPFRWGYCGCLEWEPFDQDWCADAPNPPRIQPQV